MACHADTTLVKACNSGIAHLSQQQLWIVIAQKLCESMASCDPTQLLQDACNSGIAAFNDRQLLIAIAQFLCEGGGGGGPTCLICGSGDPTDEPPCDCSLYVDTDSGNLWFNRGAVWVQQIGGP